MIPLLVLAAGVVALVAGTLVLRSFGPRYRVGRLLSTTPKVTVGEASRLARSGATRYVRVDGRIDSDEDFEDADHRPLVFRRTRLEAQRGSRWAPFEDRREAVAFQVNEGVDSIGIDSGALDAGLVVVPRESVGVAADLADRAPADLSPTTPVRARIEQVSSVEHAAVLGVPSVDGGGVARMTAGLGRPLVLTTLETPEAMRVLTGGGTGRTRLAAALLAIGALLIAIGIVLALVGAVVAPATAAAASPSATPAGAGDPRSAGEAPGLVGTPLVAIGGVVAIGVATVVVTLVYVRLTGGRRRD
ncbi:MAG: hypothetical protein ACJ77B_12550 [Chloroflexota bacterium]